MKEYLVSVIIAVYNAERYLGNTIEALMKQTYQNLEIILVDDGSNDDSFQICQLYSQKDNRIIVIHQENKGPGSARNTGIKLAKGKYLLFVDSDDFVAPCYVENLIVAITKNDYDIAISGFNKRYSDGSTQQFIVKDMSSETRELHEEIRYFAKNALIQGPCWKLFKKDIVISNNIFFHESWKYGEDSYFVYNYLQYVKSWICISSADYYYEIRNGSSLSNSFTKEKIENSIELMNLLKKLCPEKKEINWMSEILCGSFVTYCDDLVNSNFSIRKKLENITWAVDIINKSGWMDNYKEKHCIRRLFRFGIKHNLYWFLYSIALSRNLTKSIVSNAKKVIKR